MANYRIGTIVSALAVGLLAGSGLFAQKSPSTAPVPDPRLRMATENRLRSTADQIDGVVGYAIKNFKTGETFVLNENDVFPQASSIKVHILVELYRQSSAGKIDLRNLVPLTKDHQVGGGQILEHLTPSAVTMTVRDYAVFMMVQSDNSATNLLINLVGMQNVNGFLESVGAKKTRLQRVMMDYKAAAEGRENIGTPAEVLSILEKLYRKELLEPEATDDMLSIMTIEKDGPLRSGIPWEVKLANKEGEIEGVRCDVGIVFLAGAPYGICVMTKYLAEQPSGSKVIGEISRITYRYFERQANSNESGRRIPR